MTATRTAAYHNELIDGVEVEKPNPDYLHVILQRYLFILLAQFYQSKGVEVESELGVRTSKGDRIVPDIAVFELSSIRDGYIDGALWLMVEIVSPGQTLSIVLDRVERVCSNNATRAWIVDPQRQKAWEYDSLHGLTEATSRLVLPSGPSPDDLAEEESIQLADLWTELAAKMARISN